MLLASCFLPLVGTKQFARGAKVFCAPSAWGDGYEKIVVIGISRQGRRYIEVVTRSKYVENFRLKKVYKPALLKRMCLSGYLWWGDTDKDREDIEEYRDFLNNKKIIDISGNVWYNKFKAMQFSRKISGKGKE